MAKGRYSDLAGSPTLKTYTADTIQYVRKIKKAKKVKIGTARMILGFCPKNSEALFVSAAANYIRLQQHSVKIIIIPVKPQIIPANVRSKIRFESSDVYLNSPREYK